MDNNEQKVEEVVSSSEIEAPKAKKSGKTAIKVSIIVLIVAALAVGGFFAYRILMGKDPVKVTSSAIRGLKDSVADVKEDNSEVAKLIEKSDAFEISSTIKVDTKDLNGKTYKADILAQADKKGEKVKFDVKATEGYKSIIDLSALVDGAKAYFKFNDTMSNFYYTKLEEMASSVEVSSLTNLPDYKYEKLIDYLADAVEDSISTKDFEKSKEELTIGGKDIKVNKYTAKMDENKLKSIVDNFLDQASKDDDLMKVIAKLTDESESEIKDAIKEIKSTKASELGEINFDYSVYTTSTGKAVGYGFKVENAEIIIANYNDVLSIQLLAQGMPVTLEIEKKSDKNYEANLNMAGVITGTLKITSDEKVVSKGKEYKETLNIDFSLSYMGQKISASLDADTIIKKIDSVDTSAKNGAISIDSLSESELNILENQIMRSSTYKFIESIAGGIGSDSEQINYNY